MHIFQVIFLATCFLFSTLTKADLVANGNFESVTPSTAATYLQISNGNPAPTALCDCLDNWVVVDNGVEWIEVSNLGIGPAADGTHYIDLTLYGDSGGAGIKQNLVTVVGQTYTLSFSATSSAVYGRSGTGQVTVDVAGITQTFEITNYELALDWQVYSLDFTASDVTTTLKFTNTQNENQHFSFIDNVEVFGPGPLADSDGDGVPDAQDICPGGNDNEDSDGDFVPDFCDSCPFDASNDADDDGVCGDVDICLLGNDFLDGDGDSTPDACDVCPLDPANDADGDGICEVDDNCEVVPNPDQFDSDGDGFGDACDLDSDNDGVDDGDDNCPYDPNPNQEDYDNNDVGDACDFDVDGDGVDDVDDQCPSTVLGDQVNASGCSISEICPCDNQWKNHGSYVRCIAQTSDDFVESGLITEMEKDAIVSQAGVSDCGHKK